MTKEELDRRCTEASWLIARTSASAAGKALLFSAAGLEEAVGRIAAIYELSEEEVERLRPDFQGGGAVAEVQKVANGLFGDGDAAPGGAAMGVARTAIRNGRAIGVLTTLMKAGPRAAQAAATGGAVASRGTPWGWIATAAYAAGTAGWFAYNARAFNLAAYELVRVREGIEPAVEPVPGNAAGSAIAPAEGETMRLAVELPTPGAVAARAARLAAGAGSAVVGAFGRLRRPWS